MAAAADVDDSADVVVIGAGICGLGVAAFTEDARRRGQLPPAHRCLVIEAAPEPGGYCRTVERDGFVFDYAGHFFHFRDPSVHAFVHERLPPGAEHALVEVVRRADVIDAAGERVGYPYQAHVGDLPIDAARRCLVDLWHAEHRHGAAAVDDDSLLSWLRRRLGGGLCARFLEPYNEKLYGDLATLTPSCMGRFFPEVRFDDAMGARGQPRAYGYNATFTYPRRGAQTYVRALQRDLDPAALWLGDGVVAVDLAARVVTTARGRRARYRRLVATSPLPRTLALCGLQVDAVAFRASRVLVFNLGFDRRSAEDVVHWRYVAQRDVPFYRVGSYSAITGGNRLSLYVEVGLPPGTAPVDADATLAHVLAGLRAIGVVTDHQLVCAHHVLMDPAYVHLTPAGQAATATALQTLAARDVTALGRYGAWTYCSIEDGLRDARAFVEALPRSRPDAPLLPSST